MLPDPVCGMEIPNTSAYRVTRNGETFCFCSNGCRQRFLRHPSEYLIPNDRAMAPVTSAPQTSGRRVMARSPEPRAIQWTDYVPLIALIDVALLVACAKQVAQGSEWDGWSWMQDFMGLSFALVAMLKFFDLQAFADGFRAYDLLAKAFRPYAYLYPFLELGLGLALLAHWRPVPVLIATLALMLFSALGVARALWQGLEVECACLGNVLKVPLSRVAAAEYIAMAVMAAAMLYQA